MNIIDFEGIETLIGLGVIALLLIVLIIDSWNQTIEREEE